MTVQTKIALDRLPPASTKKHRSASFAAESIIPPFTSIKFKLVAQEKLPPLSTALSSFSALRSCFRYDANSSKGCSDPCVTLMTCVLPILIGDIGGEERVVAGTRTLGFVLSHVPLEESIWVLHVGTLTPETVIHLAHFDTFVMSTLFSLSTGGLKKVVHAFQKLSHTARKVVSVLMPAAATNGGLCRILGIEEGTFYRRGRTASVSAEENIHVD